MRDYPRQDMYAITHFHNFMSLYQGRFATALAKTLNTSVFAASALDIALATGAISLDKLHLLLGCSRGQAIGGAFDLQEQGLAKDIESTKSQSGEYFLVPIDERCEAARLYRTKLEKLSRQQGLSDAFDKTLPALQAIFLEALSAMEGKHINQSSS
ncbi:MULTISPECIES: hypothetical protein [Burkholderia]|uniref:hypothetical protein n=1 Tax=Burkholderia TaxID=32008 RepID=UPI0000E95893|nr:MULTISPECIES: hypothetical protein [Burkholderia]MCA8410254.1 hypothetical protein [Burkholderia multivorans]MCA8437313.1 hypothetical protein [Burkholderia multivorans]TCT30485.1 hypothetical protein EC918_10438 [Burkholderia vietnamiensis]SCZ25341.1 hypothetical protein SAMN02787148_104350 [Burkholderia vietnamiensis]SFX42046.1 hypothetical protein SAMN02787160_104350 [Burkholderia vietnamiensis]